RRRLVELELDVLVYIDLPRAQLLERARPTYGLRGARPFDLLGAARSVDRRDLERLRRRGAARSRRSGGGRRRAASFSNAVNGHDVPLKVARPRGGSAHVADSGLDGVVLRLEHVRERGERAVLRVHLFLDLQEVDVHLLA